MVSGKLSCSSVFHSLIISFIDMQALIFELKFLENARLFQLQTLLFWASSPGSAQAG